MKGGLLIFLAVCAFSSAMVPRERRALNSEEEDVPRTLSIPTTSSKTPRTICAPQTPCAWATYNPSSRAIEVNITNTYCDCGPGTVCLLAEDDTAVSAYTYRCKPPSADSVGES